MPADTSQQQSVAPLHPPVHSLSDVQPPPSPDPPFEDPPLDEEDEEDEEEDGE